jgi:hypothetical protein
LSLCDAVLDCQILALKKACFLQALSERDHPEILGLSRLAVEPPDYGHRRLLRARRKRPHRSAAEK